MPLLEIAEKLELRIIELGARAAFPVNLSINEIAAHSTPAPGDTLVARGLLKVDVGVHIDGNVADTAISLNLDNNPEYQKLIDASAASLASAISLIKKSMLDKGDCPKIREVGAAISKSMSSFGAQAVQNLSGHAIEQYILHAGITIPNYDNAQEKTLPSGLYAIEPFATLLSGKGTVRDGRPSGIFSLLKESPARDLFAREVLQFIKDNYGTLPFCTRWLHAKFGSRALLALARLEQSGIIRQYEQLIESSRSPVAQAEHTLYITEKEVIVTTG